MSQCLIQENKTLKKENNDLKNENAALRVSLGCIESMYFTYMKSYYFTSYISKNIIEKIIMNLLYNIFALNTMHVSDFSNINSSVIYYRKIG